MSAVSVTSGAPRESSGPATGSEQRQWMRASSRPRRRGSGPSGHRPSRRVGGLRRSGCRERSRRRGGRRRSCRRRRAREGPHAQPRLGEAPQLVGAGVVARHGHAAQQVAGGPGETEGPEAAVVGRAEPGVDVVRPVGEDGGQRLDGHLRRVHADQHGRAVDLVEEGSEPCVEVATDLRDHIELFGAGRRSVAVEEQHPSGGGQRRGDGEGVLDGRRGDVGGLLEAEGGWRRVLTRPGIVSLAITTMVVNAPPPAAVATCPGRRRSCP